MITVQMLKQVREDADLLLADIRAKKEQALSVRGRKVAEAVHSAQEQYFLREYEARCQELDQVQVGITSSLLRFNKDLKPLEELWVENPSLREKVAIMKRQYECCAQTDERDSKSHKTAHQVKAEEQLKCEIEKIKKSKQTQEAKDFQIKKRTKRFQEEFLQTSAPIYTRKDVCFLNYIRASAALNISDGEIKAGREKGYFSYKEMGRVIQVYNQKISFFHEDSFFARNRSRVRENLLENPDDSLARLFHRVNF